MLVDKGAASRNELDDASREIEAAEAELTIAKAALDAVAAQGDNTIIRAPFDGTVTERLHNPGDAVRADESDPILRLIDPRQVHVRVTLPVACHDEIRHWHDRPCHSRRPRFARGRPAGVVEGRDPATARERREDRRRDARVRDADRAEARHAGGIEIDAEQRSNVPIVPAIAVLKDDPAQPVVVVAARAAPSGARS
jgi:multidrug efflux pump subunit AcrA (membrane-fusion protein)